MKIICIGRNYAAHAAEMKAEAPSEPVFFMKPDTALHKEDKLFYPDFTADLQHEVEVVVKISKAGKHIQPEFASKYYNEVGLGIDFTARDLQAICKSKGLPWEVAKSFDHSALISKNFIPVSDLDPGRLNFGLQINGKTVQTGNTQQMIFSIDFLISWVSKFITLKTGDLLYTGTPEGVGPVKLGDRLIGTLEDREMFSLEIC